MTGKQSNAKFGFQLSICWKQGTPRKFWLVTALRANTAAFKYAKCSSSACVCSFFICETYNLFSTRYGLDGPDIESR
jgi:hypothetical protein